MKHQRISENLKFQDDKGFDYDTMEKIDKKFNYYCRNFSHLWQKNDLIEEDSKTPKNFISFEFPGEKKNKNANFRSVIRKKALIPYGKNIPFSKYSPQEQQNDLKSKPVLSKFDALIKKIGDRSHKKENNKLVKFDTDSSLLEKAHQPSPLKKIDSAFKEVYFELYDKNSSRKNMIDFFGNAVIAAFIESLINISMAEIQKLNEKNTQINLEPWY